MKNNYLIKIYYYNSKVEEFEITAESSRKAILTLLENFYLNKEKNIDTLKINRIS